MPYRKRISAHAISFPILFRAFYKETLGTQYTDSLARVHVHFSSHILSNDIRVSGTDTVIYINSCFLRALDCFIERVTSHFHANQWVRESSMTLPEC